MNPLRMIAATIIPAIVLLLPGVVQAISYPPSPDDMEIGAKVCLFQSGTADIKAAVGVHDTLVVYRREHKGAMVQVGKLTVVSYVGEYYMLGEVVEGVINKGDLATRNGVACLVVSQGGECR
jgi:hypothetical protein